MDLTLQAPAQPIAIDWPQVRIALTYLWRHRRFPALDDPRRFTELVQARKLFDRDPQLSRLSDKVTVKAHVAEVLGREWCVPTLWSGECLPPRPPFVTPTVVKSRHGCNQYALLRAAPSTQDWHRLQRRARLWTARPYGEWLDEWLYRDIPRGLLTEPMIGGGGALPVDYKVYVFGGRATHVQVHLDREHGHRWVLHDRAWCPLARLPGECPPPPRSLAAMLEAAETLARGLSFARVDFYDDRGTPLFGEFSFYPGSGLDPFAEDWIDFELGSLWRAALADYRGTNGANAPPGTAEAIGPAVPPALRELTPNTQSSPRTPSSRALVATTSAITGLLSQ